MATLLFVGWASIFVTTGSLAFLRSQTFVQQLPPQDSFTTDSCKIYVCFGDIIFWRYHVLFALVAFSR